MQSITPAEIFSPIPFTSAKRPIALSFLKLQINGP